MHIKFPPRRCETVVTSRRRCGASDWCGEVLPDHRDGVIGVKVTNRVSGCVSPPVNVEFALHRREAVKGSGRRCGAGGGRGQVSPAVGDWIIHMEIVEETCAMRGVWAVAIYIQLQTLSRWGSEGAGHRGHISRGAGSCLPLCPCPPNAYTWPSSVVAKP